MVDGGIEEGFEEQERAAAFRSRGHVWRTAAVMTCFFLPLGPLFGVAALLWLNGLGAALDGGREVVADNKLSTARTLVLVGTVLGAFSVVAASFGAIGLLFSLVQRFVGTLLGAMRG